MAYEKAVVEVFDALDQVEKIVTGKDYLVGDKLTEADVRLWVTIVRLNYYRTGTVILTSGVFRCAD